MNFNVKVVVALSLIFMPQFLMAYPKIVDWVLFSDKAYVKEMEVKACIITQEQACAALCNPPQEPIQLDNSGLYRKKTYLFLQVRNNGEKHAWGVLACQVPTYYIPIKISILGLGRSDNYSYNTYLIYLGSLLLTSNETGAPEINIEWDELYTK